MNSSNINPAHSAIRSYHRIAILTDGHSSAFVAKTAISLLRYRSDDLAAVIDQTAAGQTAQAFLSRGGEIPVVKKLTAITDVDALYIGIAPPGRKDAERMAINHC